MKDWITKHQKQHRKIYSNNDFEITVRELILSFAIIAFMLIIGFIISSKIQAYEDDKNAEYQKAIHITDKDLFQYAIDTNVGNVFVYGKLKAVDTVSYPEIKGKYMYLEKVKEEYTRHTRFVTQRVGNITVSRTEVYYTWDKVGREKKHSKTISFLGNKFPYKKIDIPSMKYIKTIKESSKIRYKYYACKSEYTGTLYTRVGNETISDSSDFYNDRTIQECVDNLTSNFLNVLFWIIWIVIIVCVVFSFYYFDNKWLE